jgi:hypothetical protein
VKRILAGQSDSDSPPKRLTAIKGAS